MIEVKDVAAKLQNILNANELGKRFKIFADTGELKKSLKRESEWRNGLVEFVSSTISTVENMQFLTVGVNLTLFANIDVRGFVGSGDNKGDSIEVIELKQILNDLIAAYNWKTVFETFGGTTYTTTYGFRMPTNLPKTSIGYINECLPIVLSMDLTLFENGVNANQWQIKVNGEPIAFTNCVISRVKTSEQNPLADNTSTKAANQTNAIGIDFSMPQLITAFSDALESEILGVENNKAYCVDVKGRANRKAFICATGNTSLNLTRNTNAGFNVSLVEHLEDLLNYDKNIWLNFEIEIKANNVTINNLNEQEIVIFWGDGTQTISSASEILHNYAKNELYSIKIFNAAATDEKWIDYYNVAAKKDISLRIMGNVEQGNYACAIDGYTNNDGITRLKIANSYLVENKNLPTTEVGENAFAETDILERLILPETINVVGVTSLNAKTVKFLSTTPPNSAGDPFTEKVERIEVPKESVFDYSKKFPNYASKIIGV